MPALSRGCARRSSPSTTSRLRPGRRERPRDRPAAHALGPLLAAQRLGPPRAARRLAPPVLDRRFPGGVRHPERRGARPAGRGLRARRAAARRRPASPSSTSSTATATSATSCSRPATGRAATAARSRTARASCGTVVEGIRAEAPGLRVGVRFSIFDAVPYRKDAEGRGVPESDPARYEHGFGVVHDGDLEPALADARELPRPARDARRALGLHERRQPLLQPAPAAAGALPAERRLPPARGPAHGRRAPDRGDGAAQGRLPRHRLRGLGLQLPAGVAAERGRARAARGPGRLRGPRPHGAVLPRAAGGRARGPAARPQAHLPHLQRLHDRAAQGPALGLLSARLPSTPSGRRPRS